MIRPLRPPVSCSRRNLPSPDGLRHHQVGEAIENGRPDMGFGHLALEGAREHPVAQLLEAKHHALSMAAPVVATVVFPSVAPSVGNGLEDGVLRMIVTPRDRALSGDGPFAWT